MFLSILFFAREKVITTGISYPLIYDFHTNNLEVVVEHFQKVNFLWPQIIIHYGGIQNPENL